jgi:hypothetical protein
MSMKKSWEIPTKEDSPILPKVRLLTISNKGLEQDLKIFVSCLICILNGGKGASNGELKDVFF